MVVGDGRLVERGCGKSVVKGEKGNWMCYFYYWMCKWVFI